MKNYFVPVLIFFVFIWALKGINSGQQSRGSDYNVTVTVDSDAKDGLDLEALIELVKKGKNAKDIESKLNNPGGINNLDLDEDGKVDFIKVTEYGNKKDAYGFSFTVELEGNEEQEIAEIEIDKEGDNANISARGNEQVYGQNHYYRGHHPITTFLLWSYLIRPHPFYYSPFGYGRYPGYYRSYSPVSRSVYRSNARNLTRNSTTQKMSTAPKSRLTNPNKGKFANSGIKKSLANPTSTQKQFTARNRAKNIKSGGFGRKKSALSNTKTRRSYSARSYSSGGGFGGGGK
jgi:hypothetical protein